MSNELTFEDAAPDSGVSFEDAAPEAPKEQPKPAFNTAQYIAGGGGMAGLSLIPPPGPAGQSPFGSYIQIPRIKATSLPGQIAAAPVDVASSLAEGIVSPIGVATAALGPIPKLAQSAIGAGFGVPAIKQGLVDVYEGTALKDPRKAIGGALQAITGGLITGGAAHGVMPEAKPNVPRGTPVADKTPTLAPSKRVQVVEESLFPWLSEEQRKVWDSLPDDVKARAAFLGISSHNFDVIVPKAQSDLAPKPTPTPSIPIPPQRPESNEQKNVPPSGEAGEAQPSAGPGGATVETPVPAGETPQAMSETDTPEQPKQVGSVTQEVTESVGPEAKRRFMVAPDPEVLSQASRDLQSINPLIGHKLTQSARGVVVGAPTPVDSYFSKAFDNRVEESSFLKKYRDEEGDNAANLYNTFEGSRALLRQKYGDTVTLWRAQGQGKHAVIELSGEGKNTLNFASKEGAKLYMRDPGGRQLIAKAVPVDDIVSIHSPNGKYEEYIVLNKKSPDLLFPPKGYQIEGNKLVKTEPELTGMGGALAKGEIPETGAGGEKYGVAERVREERAKAGQVEPVPPGQGITTQESIDLGREVIRNDPEAPEKVMSAFENDPKKQISSEGIAVTRAHGEALAAGARNIEEQFGTESPQYEAAKDALSSWDKRTKAMQTEWHKSGMAQQGETDLDTGSFTGLERAYKDATDRDIPVPKKPQAKKIARDNKVAQQSVDEAGKKLNTRIVEKATKDPESAKVWEVAKKYLDENKGLYNFDDLRNKIAADLGMKPGEVTRVLAKDQATKRLADDLWNKQRNARRLKEQAKNWLRELDVPGYQKALASLPRFMFSLAVGGHGFVALGTHAPIVAFQPRFWNAYIRNFGRMYKLVWKPSYYEAQMQDLVRRDNYEVARRAGLQNDPFKYEEFHTTAIRDLVKSWIGEKNLDRVDKVTSAGNRGYSVLKVLRQDMFDQAWNRLPDSIRKQEGVAAAIADGVNHATGVTKKAAPYGANIALFAPRLAGSRVMWLGGDPIRAANTIANWKNASTAEKVFAINQVKEKAWVFGTFASLLAANQGFLNLAHSDQKINGIPESLGGAGFDPLASDFMKFKAAGGNIAYGGALLTLAKLPARVAVSILYQGKGSKYILEDERVDKVIGSYIRSQMSPFAGTVSDLALGRDYEERPLPKKLFGLADQEGPVPKRLQNEGVDAPFNWPEYTMTKLPIPLAEGIKEGLRASGMNEQQANAWLKAFAVSSLMAGTGTRITEDTREK